MKKFLFTAVIFLSCLFFFFSCSGDSWDDTFSGSLTLKNFTYTGANTVFFTLFPKDNNDDSGWLDFSNQSAAISPFGAQSTETGTYDITITDISLENPDFYTGDGLSVWLVIASDDNSSGIFDTGDFIMPVYSLTISDGEDVVIDGLTFDPSSPLNSAANGRYIRFRIQATLPAVVSSDSPVILRVDNGANPDFKNNAPNFRKVIFPDIRLVNDLIIYSVPDITETYFYLLGYDGNKNGSIDVGDYASENDSAALINNITVNAGDFGEVQADVKLNGITRITN